MSELGSREQQQVALSESIGMTQAEGKFINYSLNNIMSRIIEVRC